MANSKDLVIVEASGKADGLKRLLRTIGYPVDVIATVGHIADNPRSLGDIALDEQFSETSYGFRQDRAGIISKIREAAAGASRVFLAMDDDQEGDVIAYDVFRALPDYQDKLLRVRLRALTEAELKDAFDSATPVNFSVAAANGICRRIVDRAIGATFTQGHENELIPVGRVQSSLLAQIDIEPPQIGRFVMRAKFQDGDVFYADVPVSHYGKVGELAALGVRVENGDAKILDLVETLEPLSHPWGYEEVVAECSMRLKMGISDAAEAFQQAYERGLVSYPRVRKNGFTEDAVETAARLARQNRVPFDARALPLRAVGTTGFFAHEAPRPVDDEMILGRPLAMLDGFEAVAVLIARNMLECGQLVKTRKLTLQVHEREFLFVCRARTEARSWKRPELVAGYQAFSREYSLLQYMSKHDLGRPSTVVGHVVKALSRNVLSDDGLSLGLTTKGRSWLAVAERAGFGATTAQDMELAFAQPMQEPGAAARRILEQFEMLPQVIRRIELQKSRRVPTHDQGEIYSM